jgi:hypothetical protein
VPAENNCSFDVLELCTVIPKYTIATETFMTGNHLAKLPTTCVETVRSALTAAFGSAQIRAITPIVGGASGAFAFRVEIGDR